VPVVWTCARTEGAIAMKAAASTPLRRICFADFISVNLVCLVRIELLSKRNFAVDTVIWL
jgi:hypothetical protein